MWTDRHTVQTPAVSIRYSLFIAIHTLPLLSSPDMRYVRTLHSNLPAEPEFNSLMYLFSHFPTTCGDPNHFRHVGHSSVLHVSGCCCRVFRM